MRKRFWFIIAALEVRCAFLETRYWLCGPEFDELAYKAHARMIAADGQMLVECHESTGIMPLVKENLQIMMKVLGLPNELSYDPVVKDEVVPSCLR